MEKFKIRETLFAELVRIEAAKVAASLDAQYSDGGVASGARQRELAKMAVQAFQDADHCSQNVWVWSENNK